jgi:hypothetical protein
MPKMNCWEFMKCGREPGGAKAKELGVCPAATKACLNGLNCGKNAGRCCWAIAGTFCEGDVEGVFAKKLTSCLNCEFFKMVANEEGGNLSTTKDVLGELSKEKRKKIPPSK